MRSRFKKKNVKLLLPKARLPYNFILVVFVVAYGVYCQVLYYFRVPSTLLRRARNIPTSNPSRTHFGGLWLPWPPSVTGIWGISSSVIFTLSSTRANTSSFILFFNESTNMLSVGSFIFQFVISFTESFFFCFFFVLFCFFLQKVILQKNYFRQPNVSIV